MLAQANSVDLFQEYWLILGGIIPFLFPFFIKAGAADHFKLIISLGLSVAVGLATMVPLSWDDVTADLVIARSLMFVGIVQGTYQLAKIAVKKVTLDPDMTLSKLPFYRPTAGLGRDET